MSAAPSVTDVERFRLFASRWLGLYLDDGKMGALADLLRNRVAENGRDADLYLSRLEAVNPPQEELRVLAQELTVTETSFFRNTDQMRAFGEAVLPDRFEARSVQRKLRILSAGCASGEEAYSLAIILRNLPQADGWNVSIHGIDANIAMLKKAAAARYSTWSLRQTPAMHQKRFFRAEGRDFALAGEVCDMATFEERNLAANDAAFWQPDAFDIVFCRNVIMYFTPEVAQAVIARIARSLTPGGFLFLGHAETLRGLSQEFHLRHTHGTFYYQRRDEAEQPYPARAASVPGPAPLPSAIVADESWVDTIRRASERVRSLTAAGSRPDTPAVARKDAFDPRPAIELLRHERFSEAQAMLDALPSDTAQDPEFLLLTAVLLTHGGNLAKAENVCAELLERDEMSAGAQYLMALCRESAGDGPGAADHDQVATYLDPGFAMPRLHLGLLARRAGDRNAAREELLQALMLLQREDSSRLLLFGGGFGREALSALCRAELAGCGGAP